MHSISLLSLLVLLSCSAPVNFKNVNSGIATQGLFDTGASDAGFPFFGLDYNGVTANSANEVADIIPESNDSPTTQEEFTNSAFVATGDSTYESNESDNYDYSSSENQYSDSSPNSFPVNSIFSFISDVYNNWKEPKYTPKKPQFLQFLDPTLHQSPDIRETQIQSRLAYLLKGQELDNQITSIRESDTGEYCKATLYGHWNDNSLRIGKMDFYQEFTCQGIVCLYSQFENKGMETEIGDVIEINRGSSCPIPDKFKNIGFRQYMERSLAKLNGNGDIDVESEDESISSFYHTLDNNPVASNAIENDEFDETQDKESDTESDTDSNLQDPDIIIHYTDDIDDIQDTKLDTYSNLQDTDIINESNTPETAIENGDTIINDNSTPVVSNLETIVENTEIVDTQDTKSDTDSTLQASDKTIHYTDVSKTLETIEEGNENDESKVLINDNSTPVVSNLETIVENNEIGDTQDTKSDTDSTLQPSDIVIDKSLTKSGIKKQRQERWKLAKNSDYKGVEKKMVQIGKIRGNPNDSWSKGKETEKNVKLVKVREKGV